MESIRKIVREVLENSMDRYLLIPFYEDSDFDEYGMDEYEAADEAEAIAKDGGVTILRGQELSAILIDSVASKVIGGLWVSNNSDKFSFDIAIDSSYQNMGLSSKLIDAAISEYEQQKDIYGDDFKMEVDVINPKLAQILEKKYGFHVVANLSQDRVLMSIDESFYINLHRDQHGYELGMYEVREMVRSILSEEVIEETYTANKDLEKLTTQVLFFLGKKVVERKEAGSNMEMGDLTQLPWAATGTMDGSEYEEIGDFVKDTSIRIVPVNEDIGYRKGVRGQLQYSHEPNSRDTYKIYLKYDDEDLKKINDLFKEYDNVDYKDVYFKLYYMFHSTLLHELQHAYDAYRSKGKAFKSQESEKYKKIQSKRDAAQFMKKSDSDYTEEEIEAINKGAKAYLNLVHEINARYAQALHNFRFTKLDFDTFLNTQVPWEDAYKDFKREFVGWEHLSSKMKKKLTTRFYKAYLEAWKDAEKENKETEASMNEGYLKENERSILYHGSPYEFEKFDISRIGTGDERSKFGWGLYFTDSPKTALQYAKDLSIGDKKKTGFNVYEVKINGIEKFINWDEPAYQAVECAIDTLRYEDREGEAEELERETSAENGYEMWTARELYEWLEYVEGGKKGATEFLYNNCGINGVIGQTGWLDGNVYVAFSDEIIKMVDHRKIGDFEDKYNLEEIRGVVRDILKEGVWRLEDGEK